ncbi:MAG: AMP-binding protein [Kiritimatiellales bacterium]|nr:AMP-binding protein [Kiritimatiellales bacterium]
MTIKDCLNRAADESPDSVALRFKRGGEWQKTSFRELRERVWHVSEMLVRLGVAEGDRVAIFRENSPEWYELYHGIVSLGAIAVPVDAKLRELEVAHVLHDCGVSVAFTSCRFADVLRGLHERLRDLRAIVMLDCDDRPMDSFSGVEHHSYEQLWQEVAERALAEGRAFDRFSPEATAPASYIYTSGTTGRQKGAVLTHHNFMSNVFSIQKAVTFSKDDNVALILPLHHSFAFTTTLLMPLFMQCEVTIIESLKTLKSNMEETAPTILLAVPLLLEKMLSRFMESIQAKRVPRLMYRYGLAGVIGRKVKQSLGGALRLVVSGGAPISPGTLQAWSRLGFCIIEGYGITETAPVLSVNPPGRQRVGTVGLPLDGVEIRIHEPNNEGVGEIVARGDNVMPGYYNNPEETAKVLVDGWYHTGDLGHFDEAGYLVISGRKKSLIVNREGKNIYPEEVEQQVQQSRYVLECLAIGFREPGEDIGERVGLIVVPDQEVFDAMEDRQKQRYSEQQIEQVMLEDVRLQLDALSDYKRPRRIQIRFEEFEKTTTGKVKRYLYAIDTADPA